MKKETTLYCQKKKNKYYDFYGSKMQVEMCGAKDKDVKRVKITNTISKKPTHYGWWDNKRKEFCMIFQSFLQVDICFPGGSKICEERGEGKVYKLKVIEI